MNQVDRADRTAKWLKKFVGANLIASVVSVLLVCWVIASYMVFQAERGVEGSNINTFGDGLWWGVVTFLTVGYGDKFPITLAGRMWAGGLMFAGVLSVAIVTSKISSFFLEQTLRAGRGTVNTAKLKDHFIVCGWKEDMHELLNHILDFNPGLNSSDVVLVANLAPAMIENLHDFPRLKNLQVVIGNYFEAVHLERAAPQKARKILILADRMPQPNGTVPSMTEVDARTIMTAMTLSNIARGTLVTAEILDPKMDQYLKLASVSEIIYSREYSRLLLGNASGGTGISNIIFDLLDPKTPTLITTRPVPDTLLNHAYPGFKDQFETLHPDCVVIGILENTGNSQTIKEQALRQAQKTPDVMRLVENLRGVKELRCNHPVFNPGREYLVREGSMAIVVETRNYSEGKDARPKTVAA